MDQKKHQGELLTKVSDIEGQESLPGVIAQLGELKPSAVITEEGIANLFHRHVTSVKRAVDRSELPPPMRLFGSNAWTAGVLVAHFEARQAEAAKESDRMASRIAHLSP
jgi:hypothetical protein